VSIQQSFHVLHIFVTMCNDLHDDEVFDSRQPDGNIAHEMSACSVHSFLLKRQAAEYHIDSNVRLRMFKQQDA